MRGTLYVIYLHVITYNYFSITFLQPIIILAVVVVVLLIKVASYFTERERLNPNSHTIPPV